MNVESLDFDNTEIAFSHKTDKELKKTTMLFGIMNKTWVVNLANTFGLKAFEWKLPFVKTIARATIFDQFLGGTSLLESQKSIDKLYRYKALTILDYGAEGKEEEEDFNLAMRETLRAIDFAASNESVPCVSSKLTALTSNSLLEKMSRTGDLNEEESQHYRNMLKRIDSICSRATEKKVGVMIDAEESWMQEAIDRIVNLMMKRYNKERVIVYNTFQLYRKDRLQYLRDSYARSLEEGYLLGAKLVRGAYMEKERERAREMGYESPICDTKEQTDKMFDDALRFCVEHVDRISVVCASHNKESNYLLARLIVEKNLDRKNPHLNFSQLYGMSDNITFNLAKHGFNAAKYLPYGPVGDAIPYLIRRAQENTSVAGEMSREYGLLNKEMKRRNLT